MKITIVGGGFGGVKAALELAKYPKNQITLISKQDYFQYYPSLYRTATGYSYTESWILLSELFSKHRNVHIVKDEIVSIDPTAMTVIGKSKVAYSYHKLIMALGSITSFFGIEGVETYSYGIKSEEEIRRLQRHINSELSDGVDEEKHYVIIGAGPTGVELAGALGDYIRTLRNRHGISKRRLNINLVEAKPRVLPCSSKQISSAAARRLRKLGVHVQTNCKVEKQSASGLIINGKPLESQTVIWTSGVANSPFYGANKDYFTLSERGKVIVNEFLQARPHVYVIGDNAATPFAGLAQTALHDASFVAGHIMGKKDAYEAHAPASVVPIGRHWAVFEWKNLKLSGWVAAILRECADIIGFCDIMPFSKAISRWVSGKRRKLLVPDDVVTESKLA